MRCPYCDSKEVIRSRRRNVLERYVVTIFMYFPFRCTACKRRFFRRHTVAILPEGSVRRRVVMWAVLFGVAITAFLAISITTSRNPEKQPQFKMNKIR
jgi:hypothetical protein